MPCTLFHPIQSYDPGFDGDDRAAGLDLAGTTRTVSDEDIFGAVNEGYADLFSFYTFGAKAGLVKNVDCFETNRDLTSSVFADGRLKVLDADILATFMATTQDASQGCKTPNFQDIHAVGAVVSYGVERLFSQAVPGSDDAAAVAKAALLIDWATRMGDAVRANGKAVSFELLIKQALVAAYPSKALPAAACDVVRTQFPTYAPLWFAHEFSCK